MMKKDLLNKQVVRAISLGLSAVMLTTPMTAMAAEGADPVDSQEPKEVDVKEESKYEAAEDAVEAAQDSTTDGGSIVLENAATLPSGTEVNVIPDADDAAGADALKDVTAKVDGEDVDYTDVAADETAANEELVSAEAGLIQTDASEAAAAVDVADANKITEEIEDNNAVITEAGQKADDAADAAAEAAKEADEATTKAAAQAAIDKAEAAVADAEAAQAEAQAAYDENVSKLTDAEAELAAAQANLEAAKASLTATKADVAEAAAAVIAAEEKAAALKAEVDADAEELNSSEDALLKAAYEKMMAEKSVYNLYEDYGKDENEDGVGDEWLDEFGVEGAGSEYWSAADAYFELYLKYVYGDNYVSGEWTKNTNTLDNGLAYDAERDNVFTVTYWDKDENGNDVQKTALYNYHTADKDGNISIYEKEVASETVVHTTKEVSSENAMSIKNTDENGNVTYTKYDDVKGEEDVVVNKTTDEDGNATSILVKDADSQLVDSSEISLEGNQTVDTTTESVEYTTDTIQVPVSYGTKEVNVKYVDRLATYDNLKDTVEEFEEKYPAEDGYRIEIVFDEGFGKDRVITLEEAKDLGLEIGSVLGSMWDCGFEVNVYQTVEDKDNVTEWADQDIIVKTTYADVTTVTTHEVTDDGYVTKKKAEKAAEKKAAELGLQPGTYTIDVELGWDLWEYEIKYTTSETETKVVKTESYSATSYEMNTIVTETTIETQEEVKYWTERKNTTNDAAVKAAIDGITEKLNAVKEKQDAAAIALIAAQEAKKDVETAKAELEKVSVDDTAYQAALEKYNGAKAAFDAAKATLDEINEDVEAAQDAYEDAAAELGRFVPSTDDDSDDDDTTPVVIPTVTPVVDTETPVVTPAATVAAGAGQAVVDIDDEDTPLAAGIGGDAEGGEGEEIVAEAGEEIEEALVTIEDEETPLASGIEGDAKMSWWWLLIIALLGATGYKMYKDHQKKKEEAQEV